MYIVIFKAKLTNVASDDPLYSEVANKMRTLAIEKYGCLDFTACTEGNEEIALSYWSDELQIKNWKLDPEHMAAQEKGRSTWYESYSVEVVEVLREYKHPVF